MWDLFGGESFALFDDGIFLQVEYTNLGSFLEHAMSTRQQELRKKRRKGGTTRHYEVDKIIGIKRDGFGGFLYLSTFQGYGYSYHLLDKFLLSRACFNDVIVILPRVSCRYGIQDAWWCKWDDLTDACHREAKVVRNEYLLSGEDNSVFVTSHLDSKRVEEVSANLVRALSKRMSEPAQLLKTLQESLDGTCVQELFECGASFSCRHKAMGQLRDVR